MSHLIKPLFRLMVVAIVFALLMPVTTTRADPNCDRHPDNPKCSGDTSIVYTAELSLGGSCLTRVLPWTYFRTRREPGC